MKKPKIKEYLVCDQVIFRSKAWDKKTIDEFMDAYIELVESFGGETSGVFHPMTEEQLDDYLEENNRSDLSE